MIKITIEGWIDEPVVVEAVEGFLLIVETPDGPKHIAHTNPKFTADCQNIIDTLAKKDVEERFRDLGWRPDEGE